MNKFEKLIEYIINDEDQKARELFHSIVVEKSRDIYESIMDEESMEEQGHVHGGQVDDLTNELQSEEAMGEDEFSLDGDDDSDGNLDGSLPADGEEFGDGESEEEEHKDIEDKVMSIDAKLDELLAKFDDIKMDNDDFGADDDSGLDGEMEPTDFDPEQSEEPEEEPVAEAKGSGNPFAKGSGQSGSAQSGKSGSAQSGKSGSGKMESRKMSTTELMREYVDKISDITLTPGTYSEGEPVGAGGKKVSVNTKYTGQQSGPDFGGKSVLSKGGNQDQDGTSPTKASNEYTKGEGTIKSGNVNVPGGKAGTPKSTGDSYEKGGDSQNDARGNMAGTGAKSEKQGEKNTKSVVVANAGKK